MEVYPLFAEHRPSSMASLVIWAEFVWMLLELAVSGHIGMHMRETVISAGRAIGFLRQNYDNSSGFLQNPFM